MGGDGSLAEMPGTILDVIKTHMCSPMLWDAAVHLAKVLVTAVLLPS